MNMYCKLLLLRMFSCLGRGGWGEKQYTVDMGSSRGVDPMDVCQSQGSDFCSKRLVSQI